MHTFCYTFVRVDSTTYTPTPSWHTFKGEGYLVDIDTYNQYLEAVRPVVRKALTWAALSYGL